jgi:hypothetical protein
MDREIPPPMEKLRAQAQFQLAIHPLALLGYSAQKIVNKL